MKALNLYVGLHRLYSVPTDAFENDYAEEPLPEVRLPPGTSWCPSLLDDDILVTMDVGIAFKKHMEFYIWSRSCGSVDNISFSQRICLYVDTRPVFGIMCFYMTGLTCTTGYVNRVGFYSGGFLRKTSTKWSTDPNCMVCNTTVNSN